MYYRYDTAVMSISYVLLLSLFMIVGSKKLTFQENNVLRNRCGFPAKLSDHQTAKLYGAGVKAARYGQFPWAVAIRNPVNEAALCTGAFISSRHILTAAHCFVVEDEEKCKNHTWNSIIVKHKRVKVLSGDVDVMEENGIWSSVTSKNIIIHPKYDCSIFDLALLELDQDIINDKVVPICLPQKQMQLAETFQVAGWGLAFTDYHRVKTRYMPDELMWGEVKNKGKTCQWPSNILRFMICTMEAKLDVCGGDSGGPLMQRMATLKGIKSYLVGVTSGTSDSCDKLVEIVNEVGVDAAERGRLGALFSDVRSSLNWICKVSGICYPRAHQSLYHYYITPNPHG